ncbi:MAG: molybdopterin oxidoreductase [Bdellovibrionales bacterium]|nr:molybdopterin oxidoreductase [Bdellovibrionales bacterium]
MSHGEVVHPGDPGKLVVSTKVKTLFSALMFIGGLLFIMGLVKDSQQAWHAYLVGFFVIFTFAMGGLFFTAIQHVVKAGWSASVRRICEAMASYLPLAAVGMLVFLLFGAGHVFEWLHADAVASDPLLQHKSGYLNAPFFWVRTILFFGIWVVFSKSLIGSSLKQDQTGDSQITHGVVTKAVIFVLLFAITYSFYSIDMMMAVSPHWFSTIFGVYTFGGMFQATMAVLLLIIFYLRKNGLLTGYVNENHMHDIGKFMFGFTVFWAYIAYSQFMLIWYANLPEETFWFIPRYEGAYSGVTLTLLLLRFIVPFLALLPRWAKRTPTHLAAVSILIIAMQVVDIYWLVYPSFKPDHSVLGVFDFGPLLFFAGLFLFGLTRFLSKNPVVAHKDPYIHESLKHEVIY